MKGFLGKGVEEIGPDLKGMNTILFGERSTHETIDGITLEMGQGKSGEGFVQSLKGTIDGVAHLATLPIRILDALTCGTGLIHCPPEKEIAPADTPNTAKPDPNAQRFPFKA